MLGHQSEFLLKQVLDTIAETELVLEGQRQDLCFDSDFNLHSAFCRLDHHAHGNVCAHDILVYLKQSGFAGIGVGDCARLLRYFDSDGDSQMNFQDFQQIVLPCEDSRLRRDVLNRPRNRVGRFDTLRHDLEAKLAQLINTEVDFQRRVQMLLRDLYRQPDYSPQAAFRTIDSYNSGFITEQALGDFFKSHGLHLSRRDVMAAIRRIDINGDARIDYKEFREYFRSDESEAINAAAREPAQKSFVETKRQEERMQQQRQGIMHRAKIMQTPSMLDANIQRDIDRLLTKKLGRGDPPQTGFDQFRRQSPQKLERPLVMHLPPRHMPQSYDQRNSSPLRQSREYALK